MLVIRTMSFLDFGDGLFVTRKNLRNEVKKRKCVGGGRNCLLLGARKNKKFVRALRSTAKPCGAARANFCRDIGHDNGVAECIPALWHWGKDSRGLSLRGFFHGSRH